MLCGPEGTKKCIGWISALFFSSSESIGTLTEPNSALFDHCLYLYNGAYFRTCYTFSYQNIFFSCARKSTVCLGQRGADN